MRYRTYPRTGWSFAEIGYGMWGMGGWSGSDDEQSLGALDEAIALGCNVFDTAWAYGDGHSEQLLGETLRRHAGPAALRRHEDPAEEPPVAGPGHDADRRRLPARPHPRVHREEPREPRRLDDRPAAVPRLERRVGRRRRLEARGRGPQAREADRELRHQRQPLGADQRPARARHRARRRGAGRLQRLRPDARGRAVPVLPGARHRRHRARAVRRGQPHRDAPRRQRDGPRATGGTCTSRPSTSPRRCRASTALEAARARRAGACRSWPCGSSCTIRRSRPSFRGCASRPTSGRTWRRRMPNRCRLNCLPSFGRTAGSGIGRSRRAGRMRAPAGRAGRGSATWRRAGRL